VKTKHPQLLYESKLYKILQGGGAWQGGRQQAKSQKQVLLLLLPLVLPLLLTCVVFSCSWHPQCALVWRGGGLQRDGH
jgi:hypothetical protein